MSVLAIFLALALAPPQAQEGAAPTAEDWADVTRRLEALEGNQDALADSFEGLSLGGLVPPLGDGFSGLGPAASKVYGVSDGLSIGGYGEFLYQNLEGQRDRADLLRAVLYFGYKFDDRWVLNTELEFEHAGEEVAVEFAYLDFLLEEWLNLRAGLVLVPMGLINEHHEPITFLPALRPETERRILPTTWRENGLGVFGNAGPLTYRAYVVNGMDALGFDASGLRGGRQKGSQPLAEDLAFTGRLDYTATPGLVVGVSGHAGGSGQDQGVGQALTGIFDAHAEWSWRGLTLRGLYAGARVGDADRINAANGFTGTQSVGRTLEGGYVEAGYDLMPHIDSTSRMQLAPYTRWEWIDTQHEVPSGFASDPNTENDIWTFGLNFKPIEKVVVKLEYQDWSKGTQPDRVNFLVGYTF